MGTMVRSGTGVSDKYFRRHRRDGYTYFIQCEHGGPIKIGSTLDDPLKRLKAIQANCPYRLVLLGILTGIHQEANAHKQWADARLHGEWFEPTDDLKEFIDEWLPDLELVRKFEAAGAAAERDGG